MNREIQIIKFLEEQRDNMLECNCSKVRIKFWLRVLRNDFQRTDILDMNKVQDAILDKFDLFEKAVKAYVLYRDNEKLASPELWKMHEMLGNHSAPEVKYKNKLKREVKHQYNILVVHVDKITKSVRSRETKRHTKKK